MFFVLAFAAFVIGAVLCVFAASADDAARALDLLAYGVAVGLVGLALQALPPFGPTWPDRRAR